MLRVVRLAFLYLRRDTAIAAVQDHDAGFLGLSAKEQLLEFLDANALDEGRTVIAIMRQKVTMR